MAVVFVEGVTTGEVTEDEGIDATGQLDGSSTLLGAPAGPVVMDWVISDPPEFGTVTLEDLTGVPDGLTEFTGESVVWRYELDSENPAVADLVLGETLADSFVISATPTDGGDTILQTIDITIFGVCFANDTLIETETGPVRVEDLRSGQRVMTRDAGLQPIIWLGGGPCPEKDWQQDRRLWPVRIRAGAMGPGSPTRDLYVSQNHRMLMSGARAELFFGDAEVLVAAKHLCGVPGIDSVKPSTGLSYHHILFDAHHILTANGCPAESMLMGEETLVALAPDDLVSLDEILRETAMLSKDQGRLATACRRVLSRFETLLMIKDETRVREAVPA